MERFFDTKSIKDEYDMVVIGAGPAGATAALYASRDELSVLVLEKFSPGGQVATTSTIENYPGITGEIGGGELADRFFAQAVNFGATIRYGNCLKMEVKNGLKLLYIEDREKPIKAKTVVIASGCTPKMLGVPGESKFWGRGVGTCATCDGGLYRDKVVAAVGGGNTALEESDYLTRFAKKVYLIHRRDGFRGTKTAQRLVSENKKIEVVYNSTITSINGIDRINSVNIKNILNDTEKTVDVDGVFVFVGQRPLTEPYKDILELDEGGFIIAGENTHTNTAGVFAAGDIRTKEIRQVITAAADGAVAAKMAFKYLQELSVKE